jgi:dihydroxyacetone kinase
MAMNSVLGRALKAACDALISAESLLTKLDQATGDGDLGINLARGAEAIKQATQEYAMADVSAALQAVAARFQNVVGGSSGPFYAVMLLRAAQSLRGATSNDSESWARAIFEACDAIAELGEARPGDRTMLDALLPFATEFNTALQHGVEWREALESAVRAAEAGAASTASMTPRRGRARYLGERVIGHPDPGAVAVSIWLRAIQQSLLTSS